MSMGMYAISTVQVARASSNLVMTRPVKVAETISNNSHGERWRQMVMGLVERYGRSEGEMAAIFSISSVVSASRMSMASSTVTMPTILPSPSTTGRA